MPSTSLFERGAVKTHVTLVTQKRLRTTNHMIAYRATVYTSTRHTSRQGVIDILSSSRQTRLVRRGCRLISAMFRQCGVRSLVEGWEAVAWGRAQRPELQYAGSTVQPLCVLSPPHIERSSGTKGCLGKYRSKAIESHVPLADMRLAEKGAGSHEGVSCGTRTE